jgi:hypothetical protein
MSCNQNPPNPTREWSRVENRCVFDDSSTSNFFIEQKLLADMQYKGNILQYKSNSSNYTKKQIYSLIAKGNWLLRKKTYASQSDRYTNPNTNHLRRINGKFIDLNTGQITEKPDCKNPQPIIYEELPFVPDVIPDPPLPPPVPVITRTFPIIRRIITSIVTNIIEDDGLLVCTQQEDPCTGEIITTPEDERCYPTTFSDVPNGKINTLCYQQEPLYYPKTRTTMNNSDNKWPYGSKLIRQTDNFLIFPLDNSSDKPTNKPTDKPTDNPTDNPNENPTDDPENKGDIITYNFLNRFKTNNVFVATALNSNDSSNEFIMMFPASSSSKYNNINTINNTSSEAFWYYIEIANQQFDKDNIQNLFNGYFYSTQMKSYYINIANEGTNIYNYLSSSGLMGNTPIIYTPNNCLSQEYYPGITLESNKKQYLTATDADMHLIVNLYYATKEWGIDTLYCATPSEPITNNDEICSYSTMINISINYIEAKLTSDKLESTQPLSYSNLLTQAFCSFFTLNISNIPFQYSTFNLGFNFANKNSSNIAITTQKYPCNVSFNPILCNNQYGGGFGGTDALNPSYFDPHCLIKIYNIAVDDLGYTDLTYTTGYYKVNGIRNTPLSVNILSNYKLAIKNTLIYLINLQSYYKDNSNINSFGLPDNPFYDQKDSSPLFQNSIGPNGPHYVGYDSIRIIANLGYFAYLCYYNRISEENQSIFTLEDIENIKIMCIRLINFLVNNCDKNTLYTSKMKLRYPYEKGPNYNIEMKQNESLNGGALIGPLCIGMTALFPFISSDTASPFYSTITAENVYQLQQTLDSLTIDTLDFEYSQDFPNKAWINWQKYSGKSYYSTVQILYCKYYLNLMTQG